MKIVKLLALLAVGVLLPVGIAAPAHAAPPGDSVCTGDDNHVRSCFVQDTDNFWVRDTDKDGRSAVVIWSDRTGRSGTCRNAQGVNTWRMCSYQLPEFTAGGSPNKVFWAHYTYDAQTDDYNRTSYGYEVCTRKGCPAKI